MATVPTKPAPEAATVGAKAKTPQPPRDSLREIAETIVFVVALVLMLKLFVVEAFVIPTGSMAETLLGYNINATCPQCAYTFPVNASNEVDPTDGFPARPVLKACCPNCRHTFKMTDAGSPGRRSGDRLLVHKALYSFTDPNRGDIVVFKFPVDPQAQHTAQNYIKRLWGLGDETIAVHRGDLYVAQGIDYPANARNEYGTEKYPRPEDPRYLWQGHEAEFQSKTYPKFKPFGTELWEQRNLHRLPEEREPLDGRYRIDFTYHKADTALTAFAASQASGFPRGPGGFEMIRKSDTLALAMRRITFDNDYQPTKLLKHRVPPRWQTLGGDWTTDNPLVPKVFTHSSGTLSWLRYQHRLPGEATRFIDRETGNEVEVDDWTRIEQGYQEGMFQPQRITNFLGYNSAIDQHGQRGGNGDYWVGDLMIECRAKIGGANDTVILELGKGSERFRATFTGGQVAVGRAGAEEWVTKPTKLTSAGEYDLRFANIDGRLRVAVNGRAIDFGAAGDYSPADTLRPGAAALVGGFAAPQHDGHTLTNDVLAPAMIGAQGTVEVSKVVVWQDTYFTPTSDRSPPDTVDTFYVHPGHYLCLGDNSAQSSDSRKWGLVPERLMLGKAVFVFFPLSRIGFID